MFRPGRPGRLHGENLKRGFAVRSDRNTTHLINPSKHRFRQFCHAGCECRRVGPDDQAISPGRKRGAQLPRESPDLCSPPVPEIEPEESARKKAPEPCRAYESPQPVRQISRITTSSSRSMVRMIFMSSFSPSLAFSLSCMNAPITSRLRPAITGRCPILALRGYRR